MESVPEGVTRRKLVDVLRDLGFTVCETKNESSRVCWSCATQIRNNWTGFVFIKSSLEIDSHQEDVDARFKKMSASPHSSAVRKSSRVVSPLKVQN